MAGMLVLTTMQPIVGVDVHNSLPPIPVAPIPHAVVWATGLSLGMGFPKALNASQAISPQNPDPTVAQKPVAVGIGHACGRGHDAGSHLGHIAANTLLPIIFLGSASKSEFGSGTVLVAGKHMCVNMLLFLNINLDCWDPVPVPSGFTFATGSAMVFANFTWKDFFDGLVHMIVDVIIVAILNYVVAVGGKVLGKLLAGEGAKAILSVFGSEFTKVGEQLADIFGRKVGGKLVMDWSNLTARGFAKQAEAAWANLMWGEMRGKYIYPALGDAAKTAVPSWLLGSPTGASASPYYGNDPSQQKASPGLSPGSRASSAADDTIDKLFY
ncbi:MAG TPA: hypothetical protein VMT03_00875 [Polyangia bacterium]|nr:hypothetical protein [Polyangia bacterium]